MTFLIIDAQYWAHAAHAVGGNLTRADGHPIGATHGFIKRLLQFLIRPPVPFTHLAVVFDAPGRNWRSDLLPAYKANRGASRASAGASDLSRQFSLIHAATRAIGAPVVMQAGQEADDIIATLANEATKRSTEVVIVSSDKDLLQLVDSQQGVRLYDTHPSGPGNRARGWQAEEAVYARFGVRPHQIPDYLALVGDTADNIPGVPGIGPKRAQAILREHGGIEWAIAAEAVAVTPEAAETLRTARAVATLSPFVQLPERFDFQNYVWNFDRAAALAMCEEHGFRAVASLIEGAWPAPGQTTGDTAVNTFKDQDDKDRRYDPENLDQKRHEDRNAKPGQPGSTTHDGPVTTEHGGAGIEAQAEKDRRAAERDRLASEPQKTA